MFQLVSLDGRNDWCGAFFAKFSFQTGPRDAGIGKCDCRLGCSQPSIWWLPESSPSGDYLINSLSMSSIHPFLAPPGAAPDLAPEGFTEFDFYPHILSSPNMIWYGESACSKSIWKLRRNPSSWNWWWWLLMRWCTSIQSTSYSINNYQGTCPIESVIIHWAER